MRLLLDECIGGHALTKKLTAAGHDVTRSVDVLGDGVEDPVVFTFACANQHVIVTYNNADFEALATQNPKHPGMLLVYQDNDDRDMTYDDIVNAIANVEKTYTGGIAGEIVVLNSFRW